MKLPNAEQLVVEREKIVGYLLNATHRYGALSAPDGRSAQIRTVWQLDRGELAPRLITAYPLEEIQS